MAIIYDAGIGEFVRVIGRVVAQDLVTIRDACGEVLSVSRTELRRAWSETSHLMQSFYKGGNLPWISYGHDFGSQNASDGFSVGQNEGILINKLNQFAGGVVRVFVFCDLRDAVDFSGPTLRFYDETKLYDMDALLEAARATGTRIIPALFDYMISDGVGTEHPEVITNAAKRAELMGLISGFVSHYAGRDEILMWDLMNEPEWATLGVGTLDPRRSITRGEMWGLLVQNDRRGLVTSVEAPKLDHAPMTRPFLAAILRRVAEASAPRAVIADRLEQARRDGKERAERVLKARSERSACEVESLQRTIRDFEKASGVKLDSWRGREIGAAVRFVLDGGVAKARDELDDLLRRARLATTAIEHAISDGESSQVSLRSIGQVA